MDTSAKYIFQLGFKVALDNGKIFIQIRERLIELGSLSPELRRSILNALLAKGMAVAVSPWVWVAVAAYSTWLANTLASQAGGARARAEEARAQAAQAEQTAKNLQTQLDRYEFHNHIQAKVKPNFGLVA